MHIPLVPQEGHQYIVAALINSNSSRHFYAEITRRNTEPKMNTIVFNKLSSQVLFEEKAKEVERSSRNYLEVIDGQHSDLLSSNQAIKDNNAIRHRRPGYVIHVKVSTR